MKKSKVKNQKRKKMNLTKECRKVLSKNKDINTSLSFLFKNSNDKFENESAVTELMESGIPGFLILTIQLSIWKENILMFLKGR